MIQGARRREALAALARCIPSLSGGGARATLEVSLGAADPPVVKASRVIEDDDLRAHPATPAAAPRVGAFLDGVQRSSVVGWSSALPVVEARVGAVVRERRDRRMSTWGSGPVFRDAFYHAVNLPAWSVEGVPLVVCGSAQTVEQSHPFAALRDAYRMVQHDRERLEAELSEEFLRSSDEVLYVDGGLPASDIVLGADTPIGVVKSHHTLYAGGEALARVMALAECERSSVFEVESRRRAPVASWYLRLRDPADHDPFWGLVRVEVPVHRVSGGVHDAANEVSALILAERTPLALPDARWDTMVYGIRDCEEYLAATIDTAP